MQKRLSTCTNNYILVRGVYTSCAKAVFLQSIPQNFFTLFFAVGGEKVILI